MVKPRRCAALLPKCDRKHDFFIAHCSPQSEGKRLLICVTSGNKFWRQPKQADRKDSVQHEHQYCAFSNSSTQIVHAHTKNKSFCAKDEPPTPQTQHTKNINGNFDQRLWSFIYETKTQSMDNFLIWRNLITKHQGKSYLCHQVVETHAFGSISCHRTRCWSFVSPLPPQWQRCTIPGAIEMRGADAPCVLCATALRVWSLRLQIGKKQML